MRFSIDPRSPVTPSEQLADQVRFAVAAGRVGPGERLPSVREVARTARINPNTVSRAWRELELVGLIEARRGSGMFVTPEGPGLARTFRARAVAERLGRAAAEALDAGLGEDEVHELVRDACRAWEQAASLGAAGSENGADETAPEGETESDVEARG
ncbi:MAG: GntR family transcriptional regulator [Planctomycetota bacterium]